MNASVLAADLPMVMSSRWKITKHRMIAPVMSMERTDHRLAGMALRRWEPRARRPRTNSVVPE